jgi:phosphate transport system protein
MSHHFEREIEHLKRDILALATLVEESLQNTLKALRTRDNLLAARVIKGDIEIDDKEVKIEEDCLKILALHQPVAADLRFIIAVLKVNNELERIGDTTVNIAERVMFLSSQPRVEVRFDFQSMADKAQSMLHRALDALVNGDSKLAYQVIASDDEVDALNREMYMQVQEGIRRDIDDMECLIHLLGVSRHFERIADHACNIAEDAIYMARGDIVRHRHEEYESSVEAGE